LNTYYLSDWRIEKEAKTMTPSRETQGGARGSLCCAGDDSDIFLLPLIIKGLQTCFCQYQPVVAQKAMLYTGLLGIVAAVNLDMIAYLERMKTILRRSPLRTSN
jgi:hypothetical protein